jgi:predicted transposase/invertase (TIGR01784 family)
LHEGQDYLKLKPTISISFLDHVLFPQVPDYHLRFRLLEVSHQFPLTNDVEFHLLELPKFTKTADKLRSGLDIWLYFLRHAAKMDTEAVPVALQQPLVLRAVEELKMLSQTDLERERYEARRKAQLDYNTGLKVSRMEGREEGEKIGVIHLLERWLNRPETPTEQLTALSIEELTRLADGLQDQFLKSR